MLPASVTAHFKTRFQLISAQPVGGGSINECYHLKTSQGSFFLKLNSNASFPDIFEAETKGLKLLASSNSISTPEIHEHGCINDICYLLMEYIEPGTADHETMYNFGKQMARLHQNTADEFGLDHDNYIGSLPQCNTPTETWAEFFIERRLKPQLLLASKAKLISTDILLQFDKLFPRLEVLLPDERPSLLHGDLWTGNYLINYDNKACIVDPAVYYGHREMDIAMSQLFGGLSIEFYEGYNERYPLEDGWQERIKLCNLYPLLVHVNLFGRSYVPQVKSCLEKFV